MLYLRSQVQPLAGLLAFYVTGSFVRGTHVHGRSNVDVCLVLDRDGHDPEALRRGVAVLPFLAPQVVLVDERRELDNPHLLYDRAGTVAAFYEAPDFELNGSELPLLLEDPPGAPEGSPQALRGEVGRASARAGLPQPGPDRRF